MNKEIICTVCPRGCHILVTGEADRVDSLTGQSCKRGEIYAKNEFTHPVRILTSTVLTDDGELLPVRSASPVPKELLFACMEIIRRTRIARPVNLHDVVIKNIAGTGVDIISSKNLI